MNQVNTLPEVLTLEEAAAYLRVSKVAVRELTVQGKLPGRRVKRQWRFLKAAINNWLSEREKPDSWTAMAQQLGAFADDETLPALRAAIYKTRGRREFETGPDA